MDPHNFADPDPGSQNVADPTDLNPKQWFIDLQTKVEKKNEIYEVQSKVKTLALVPNFQMINTKVNKIILTELQFSL